MSRLLACIVFVAFLVAVLAQSTSADTLPGAGGWAPAAGAVGDNTYEGFIDIASGAPFQVSGWVVDMSAEGWAGIASVDVVLGSTVVAHGIAGLSRPDVANVTGNGYWANSGFDAVVPAGAVPAGTQTLTVLANTPAKGSWSSQVTVNVGAGAATSSAPSGLVLTINTPGVNEDVLANNNGTVNGSAYDTRTRPELGTGVDRVQAYLDAPRGQAGSHFLGEATGFQTTWSIGWQPTKFDSGERHHVMWVYARSAVTGEEVVQTREFNITH